MIGRMLTAFGTVGFMAIDGKLDGFGNAELVVKVTGRIPVEKFLNDDGALVITDDFRLTGRVSGFRGIAIGKDGVERQMFGPGFPDYYELRFVTRDASAAPAWWHQPHELDLT